MIFCPQCGCKIPDQNIQSGIKFCPECGSKLPEINQVKNDVKKETPVIGKPEAEKLSQNQNDNKVQTKKKPAWIYIVTGLGVGVVIAVIMLGILVFDIFGIFEETGGDNTTSISQKNDEIINKWNGSWYGILYIRSANGELKQLENQNLDVFMVVDGNADCTGEYAIFVDGSEKAIAKGSCTLRQNGLYTKNGTFCGVAVSNSNWQLFASTDDADRYTLSDKVETTEGEIAFALSVKKWGEVWDIKEGGTQLDISPSSLNAYNEMLTRGASAPYTVDGIDRSEWSKLEGTEQMSWDILVEDGLGNTQTGEPSATGDGIIASESDFWAFIRWINGVDQTTLHTTCTYSVVKDKAGVEGKDDGNHGVTSVSTQGDHYIYYYDPSQTMYICIQFRAMEESGDWCVADYTYYGFSNDDIPDESAE